MKSKEKMFFGFVCLLMTVIFVIFSCSTDSSPPPPPAYNIGDTGPAGGLIFYIADSGGSYTYYEAAPADLGTAAWGLENAAISTGDAIGTGKSNTAAMLEATPADGTAAQLCDDYIYHDIDDWFLPSYEELKKILQNLHLEGKGSFTHDTYWSSSNFGKDVQTRYAGAIAFSSDTGAKKSAGRGTSYGVRAVRSFN